MKSIVLNEDEFRKVKSFL